MSGIIDVDMLVAMNIKLLRGDVDTVSQTLVDLREVINTTTHGQEQVARVVSLVARVAACLGHVSDRVRGEAAMVLCALCVHNPGVAAQVAGLPGVVDVLINKLEANSPCVKEFCWALCALAVAPGLDTVWLASGLLERVVALMACAEPSNAVTAAFLLGLLCENSAATAAACVPANAVQALIHLINQAVYDQAPMRALAVLVSKTPDAADSCLGLVPRLCGVICVGEAGRDTAVWLLGVLAKARPQGVHCLLQADNNALYLALISKLSADGVGVGAAQANLTCLFYLCKNNPAGCERVLSVAGFWSVLAGFLRCTTARVVGLSAGLMAVLVGAPLAGVPDVVLCDTVAVLMEVLDTFPADVFVQEQAVTALYRLCNTACGRVRFVLGNGVKKVCDLLIAGRIGLGAAANVVMLLVGVMEHHLFTAGSEGPGLGLKSALEGLGKQHKALLPQVNKLVAGFVDVL